MQKSNGPPANRGLNILKLLWKRFLRQPWRYKLVTVTVILLTVVWMLLFYTSLLIWQAFSLLTTRPLLYIIEWYLLKTEDH